MGNFLVSLLGVTLIATAASAGAYQHRGDFYRNRIVAEQRGTLVRIYEPEHHLRIARRAYANGSRYLASRELESAAAAVGYLEDRASGARRRQLDQAERGLDRLARDLRRNDPAAAEHFDAALKAVDEALAL